MTVGKERIAGTSRKEVLVLFSGLNGMSVNWDRSIYNITAIEIDQDIAEIAKRLFPQDNIIIGDAVEYIETVDLNQFDCFIATPSCLTHSKQNKFHDIIKVPDYKTLFGIQDVFEYHYSHIPYIVENTSSKYKRDKYPQPKVKLGRHYFWSNFEIPNKKFEITDIANLSKNQLLRLYGLPLIPDLPGDRLRKRQIVRNILEPEIADYVLACTFNIIKLEVSEW